MTTAQKKLLQCVEDTDGIEDFYTDEGGNVHRALWFNAADKVVDACVRRGWLVSDGGRLGAAWSLTDAGRDALAQS